MPSYGQAEQEFRSCTLAVVHDESLGSASEILSGVLAKNRTTLSRWLGTISVPALHSRTLQRPRLPAVSRVEYSAHAATQVLVAFEMPMHAIFEHAMAQGTRVVLVLNLDWVTPDQVSGAYLPTRRRPAWSCQVVGVLVVGPHK